MLDDRCQKLPMFVVISFYSHSDCQVISAYNHRVKIFPYSVILRTAIIIIVSDEIHHSVKIYPYSVYTS